MSEQNLCRACKTGVLKNFLELGNVPSVNAFIPATDIPLEKKYPLNMAYCSNCLLAQLETIVPPQDLFSNYLHLSAGSATNVEHLREVASLVQRRFNLNSNSKVLEIGSNDATLLAFLKPVTSHLLGVDPAQNLVELSNQKGIQTLPLFFNTKTAADIHKSHGTYDVIIGLNVIPHTPDVVDLLKGVNSLLSQGGTLVMEGAYALETVLKGEFDTIYHEHVYSFSLHSLISTFKYAGLKIVDVEKIPTQGGSLRVFAQKESEAKSVSPAVLNLLAHEQAQGLTLPSIFDAVPAKVDHFKKSLRATIEREKKLHGKLVGLGAPARGVVILNYCGISTDDLDFIIDDTPLKQNRVTPGVHVPVKSWSALTPQHKSFLLLSWNYRDHLIEKLRTKAPQANVIIPFPSLGTYSYG